MRIALLGASGNVGTRILSEAVGRGHSVTGLSRHPERIPALPGSKAVKADAYEVRSLARILSGHDAVVSSIPFSASEPDLLISAVQESGVNRYLVVGGAGSLQVAPGMTLLSTPEFPAAYLPEATRGAAFLQRLRRETQLDWTFLSPSLFFGAGERTGQFRRGHDQLLTDATGKSWISYEDYAIAVLDELERPSHLRQRFTVGY